MLMNGLKFFVLLNTLTFISSSPMSKDGTIKIQQLFEVETIVRPLAAKEEIQDPSNIESAWERFKTNFKRVYTDVKEEAIRFEHFLRTFSAIEAHNKLYEQGKTSYLRQLNQFSDWSPEEAHRLRGFRMPHENELSGVQYLSPNLNFSLPKSMDWRKKGYVTEVKNQGKCGSCWSFSTTGSLEGQHFRKTGKLVQLSEQQLVDCDMRDNGCNGGIMTNAFRYIKRVGGLETESAYPYVSGRTKDREDSCKYNRKLSVATVRGFVQLPQGNEKKLKEAVASIGPVSIAIDVTDSFMQYSGGVYESDDCSPEDLNHAVLVVGYGIEKGVPYWLVKNSWGPDWGESGYIKMRRDNANMCGVATFPVYPLV